MRRGATVSDLHLFSHHSRPERYLPLIRSVAGRVDVFVFNGDIFDFKWSLHGVFPKSVEAAISFLEELLRSAPNCRFIFLPGNHDAVQPYLRALNNLSRTYANFDWDEFVWRLDDRLFLHGDVIHAGCTNEALRAFRNRLQRPAGGHRWQRVAHAALHRSHMSWVALKILPKRLLASRILKYLEQEGWLAGQAVHHIYFGHTHGDFEDFQFRGYRFHNCGSATHGARLRVVDFQLPNQEYPRRGSNAISTG